MPSDARVRLAELQTARRSRALTEAEWQEAALLLAQLGKADEAAKALQQAAKVRAQQPAPAPIPAPMPNPYAAAPARQQSSGGISMAVKVVLAVGVLLVGIGLVGVVLIVSAVRTGYLKQDQTACLRQEKNLCLAIMQYTVDYDGILPPNHNGVGTWPELIEAYIPGPPAFRCPSDEGSGCSYRYRNVPIQGERLDSIGDGAKVVEGADGDAQGLVPRHLGTVNCWYADGHCKPAPKDKPFSDLLGVKWLGDPGRLP